MDRRKNMWNMLRSLLKKEEGQGLTEYALIIALVAVVLVVALTALQGGISGTLNGIVGSL
jgi:pilus assembly protein Flp/PilA